MSEPTSDTKPAELVDFSIQPETTKQQQPIEFSATGLLGEFMKDFKHEEEVKHASPEQQQQLSSITPDK